MEEGKEEKGMTPLFPRVHLNDADKGGPKALPRNDVAIYEQLSVSSHKFNPRPASSFPRPPHSGRCSTMGPSPSSSQDGRHESRVFFPFHMSIQTPAQSVENVHARSSSAMNSNTETVLMMHVNRSLDAAGSFAECSTARQHDSSSGKKKLFGVKFDGDGNFKVPQTGSGKYSTGERTRCSTSLTLYDKPMEQSKALDTKSVNIETSQSEQRREKALAITEQEQKKSAPVLDDGENLVRSSPIRGLAITIDLNEDLHMESEEEEDQQSRGNDASVQNKCLNDNGSGNASSAKNESCLEMLLDNSCRRDNMVTDHNQEKENKASEGRNEACDVPMVDSLPKRMVHPDDVVESIGPKQFWKARSAIVNQQRVFAAQVFELHRLIKVQKLIAASPNMLLGGNQCLTKLSKKAPSMSLEGNQCLIKSSQQAPSEIILQQESLSKTQAVTTSQKDDAQKGKQNIEEGNQCLAKSSQQAPSEIILQQESSLKTQTVTTRQKDDVQKKTKQNIEEGNQCLTKPSKKTPSMSLKSNRCLTKSSQQTPSEIILQQESLSKTQAVTIRQKPKQNIEAPPSHSSREDGLHGGVNVQPSSWCFPPPGNQWLVPIVSPLEGLVFKPCAVPYIPNAGFMPPIYQGCAPLNATYGIPASYQGPNISVPPSALPFHANYNPASYPMPVMNQATVASAAEQVSLMDGSRPTRQTEQSSRNKSNPKAVPFPSRWRKFLRQGTGRAAEGSVQQSQGSKNQTPTRVIKAVPQNARTEPELATKIIRSIEEERRIT